MTCLADVAWFPTEIGSEDECCVGLIIRMLRAADDRVYRLAGNDRERWRQPR
jgi:hypothetical protein